MPILIVPSLLKPFVSSKDQLTLPAKTLAEVFTQFVALNPKLRPYIFDIGGQISPYFAVFVNRERVVGRDCLTYELNEGDVVALVPAFAGG